MEGVVEATPLSILQVAQHVQDQEGCVIDQKWFARWITNYHWVYIEIIEYADLGREVAFQNPGMYPTMDVAVVFLGLWDNVLLL